VSGSDLRERIAKALGATVSAWWQTPPRLDLAADAVTAEVQAELDAKDARIAELEAENAKLADHGVLKAYALEKMGAERDRLRELATEILTHFHERGHPGRESVRTCWIDEATVAEWRRAAALGRGLVEEASGT